MSERQRGSIKALHEGYGWITSETGLDHFFHRSMMERTTLAFDQLERRMAVEFDAIAGEKGPRAINVRVIP